MWLIFCFPGFTSAGFIRSQSQPSYCIGKISILLILNSGSSHHHSLLLHTLWIVCRQRAPGWGRFTACHWFQKQALHRILLICFKVAPWKLRFCHNGDLAKGIMTKSCEGAGERDYNQGSFHSGRGSLQAMWTTCIVQHSLRKSLYSGCEIKIVGLTWPVLTLQIGSNLGSEIISPQETKTVPKVRIMIFQIWCIFASIHKH